MQKNNLKVLWKKVNEKVILILLFCIFTGYSLFFAVKLKPGIIPDEPAHFLFSKHYATTLGIPSDVYETFSRGWYIKQNPFLYYWLNGRYINIIRTFTPGLSDHQLLISLRIVSTFYNVGTLVFCVFLSNLVIKKKWWRILPVFLLINTLMYVFLSGGVNYDNLANLFSMAGIYYLMRVLKKKPFLLNSLAYLTLLGLGCLVKFTILPLLLAAVITWIFFIIINRTSLGPIRLGGCAGVILMVLFSAVFMGNIAIYGVNIVRYQSLTPPCQEILLESQCEISPFAIREEAEGLDKKMTIVESIQNGYPNPVVYAGHTWFTMMILRTYGMEGHINYNPHDHINYFRILFYAVILLALIHIKKFDFSIYSLIGIFIFYAIVLLIKNYNSELIYSFQHISLQGRYIFPVIGPAYILYTAALQKTKNCWLRNAVLFATLGLFIIDGPSVILFGYQKLFGAWFF